MLFLSLWFLPFGHNLDSHLTEISKFWPQKSVSSCIFTFWTFNCNNAHCASQSELFFYCVTWRVFAAHNWYVTWRNHVHTMEHIHHQRKKKDGSFFLKKDWERLSNRVFFNHVRKIFLFRSHIFPKLIAKQQSQRPKIILVCILWRQNDEINAT